MRQTYSRSHWETAPGNLWNGMEATSSETLQRNSSEVSLDWNDVSGEPETDLIELGSISSDFTSETFEPEAIFLTSCGKVGVVIDIKDQDMAVHLSELQRNLSAQVTGVGTTNHTRYCDNDTGRRLIHYDLSRTLQVPSPSQQEESNRRRTVRVWIH